MDLVQQFLIATKVKSEKIQKFMCNEVLPKVAYGGM